MDDNHKTREKKIVYTTKNKSKQF